MRCEATEVRHNPRIALLLTQNGREAAKQIDARRSVRRLIQWSRMKLMGTSTKMAAVEMEKSGQRFTVRS